MARLAVLCLVVLLLQQGLLLIDSFNKYQSARIGPQQRLRPLWDDSEYANRPGPWDEADLHSLMDANKAWVNRMISHRPNFFENHKKGHFPKILWISCSDARVPANEVVDQHPGSVFVHRNIANQVISTDFNCMSVLQYAVEALHVRHVVVCGHYDCGGVKAALENKDHSAPLENWLHNIRDVYRVHNDELKAIHDPLLKQRRLVELNVVEQCIHVLNSAAVQRRRDETLDLVGKEGTNVTFAEPRVHGLVYEPTTGKLKKLDIMSYVVKIPNVYDLYP